MQMLKSSISQDYMPGHAQRGFRVTQPASTCMDVSIYVSEGERRVVRIVDHCTYLAPLIEVPNDTTRTLVIPQT